MPIRRRENSTRFPLADLQQRIQGVIDRKGRIEILQLSGGEPTIHPEFFELLAWLHANPGIDYVLLNTNGVRLANDDAFLDGLGRPFATASFSSISSSTASRKPGSRRCAVVIFAHCAGAPSSGAAPSTFRSRSR
jgi:MoaA/NifB/PqqE/SkfB family radical SAM enzyme